MNGERIALVLWIALAICLGSAVSAAAAERCVLAELFTAFT
jgi:hypothetical protein